MKQKIKEEIISSFDYDCGCGCGQLRFSQWKDDSMASISYVVPAWAASQGVYGGWRNALKIIWNVIRGKEHYFYEITINDNETLNRFKKFVSEMTEIEDVN
jgi:hypothetical protein